MNLINLLALVIIVIFGILTIVNFFTGTNIYVKIFSLMVSVLFIFMYFFITPISA